MPDACLLDSALPLADVAADASMIAWLFTLLAVAVAGFLGGAINAVAGGGTFVTFPTLETGVGVEARLANATNSVAILPGSVGSIFAAWGELSQLSRSLLVPMLVVSLLGGLIGAVLLRLTDPETFRFLIPILIGGGTVLFAFGGPIKRLGERVHGRHLPIACGAQFAVALYGGYFGAGIGVLMLATFPLAGIHDIHAMTRLKVVLATAIKASAAIFFLASGMFDWDVGIALAIGATLGGYWGMRLIGWIPPRVLRGIVIAVGVLLTVAYAVRELA